MLELCYFSLARDGWRCYGCWPTARGRTISSLSCTWTGGTTYSWTTPIGSTVSPSRSRRRSRYWYVAIQALKQGVTRRCRLSWRTNSALVNKSKCAGTGWVVGSQPMSAAVHITWHGAEINFGDLTPYLTYAVKGRLSRDLFGYFLPMSVTVLANKIRTVEGRSSSELTPSFLLLSADSARICTFS